SLQEIVVILLLRDGLGHAESPLRLDEKLLWDETIGRGLHAVDVGAQVVQRLIDTLTALVGLHEVENSGERGVRHVDPSAVLRIAPLVLVEAERDNGTPDLLQRRETGHAGSKRVSAVSAVQFLEPVAKRPDVVVV